VLLLLRRCLLRLPLPPFKRTHCRLAACTWLVYPRAAARLKAARKCIPLGSGSVAVAAVAAAASVVVVVVAAVVVVVVVGGGGAVAVVQLPLLSLLLLSLLSP
jgi:hypothetical protein